MVVNFRACEINQGARKLDRTPTLIKKIYIHGIMGECVLLRGVYKCGNCYFLKCFFIGNVSK
jgi:hypothetical protein